MKFNVTASSDDANVWASEPQPCPFCDGLVRLIFQRTMVKSSSVETTLEDLHRAMLAGRVGVGHKSPTCPRVLNINSPRKNGPREDMMELLHAVFSVDVDASRK